MSDSIGRNVLLSMPVKMTGKFIWAFRIGSRSGLKNDTAIKKSAPVNDNLNFYITRELSLLAIYANCFKRSLKCADEEKRRSVTSLGAVNSYCSRHNSLFSYINYLINTQANILSLVAQMYKILFKDKLISWRKKVSNYSNRNCWRERVTDRRTGRRMHSGEGHMQLPWKPSPHHPVVGLGGLRGSSRPLTIFMSQFQFPRGFYTLSSATIKSLLRSTCSTSSTIKLYWAGKIKSGKSVKLRWSILLYSVLTIISHSDEQVYCLFIGYIFPIIFSLDIKF